MPAGLPAGFGQRFMHQASFVHQMPIAFEVAPPGFGEFNAAGGSVKQTHAELTLRRGNAPRQRNRRRDQVVAGEAEPFRSRDLDEEGHRARRDRPCGSQAAFAVQRRPGLRSKAPTLVHQEAEFYCWVAGQYWVRRRACACPDGSSQQQLDRKASERKWMVPVQKIPRCYLLASLRSVGSQTQY